MRNIVYNAFMNFNAILLNKIRIHMNKLFLFITQISYYQEMNGLFKFSFYFSLSEILQEVVYLCYLMIFKLFVVLKFIFHITQERKRKT